MSPILLSVANGYISNISPAEKPSKELRSNDLSGLINKYVESNNFADEKKIRKLVENELCKIATPSFEQLQLWANIVSNLRYQEYLYQDQHGLKSQKIKTLLAVIKETLKDKLAQAIAKTKPDNVDFSSFDYFTKELYEIEKTHKNSPNKENLIKEKLAETSSVLRWQGGFPEELTSVDWLRYKKTIAFFSQNNTADKERNILSSLYKAYLFLFTDKVKWPHFNTNYLIQTFFMKKTDCDDAASFIYFILLANGLADKDLHLLHIKTDSDYEHAVLCFTIKEKKYVIDDTTLHTGTSYRVLLEELFARDISKAQISIFDAEAHTNFFYTKNHYLKKNIQLHELDKILTTTEQ